MLSALLVIDVQRALCVGELAAFEIEQVIDRINLVSERARRAGRPVIFIQHESDDGIFAAGSDGWKLADGLIRTEADIVIAKRGSDAFHKTNLQSTLKERDIARLIICGLQSDYCIDSTTRRALALGYSVTLVCDGHSTIDNGCLTAAQISAHHTLTLTNITSYGSRATPFVAADIEV